jgi:hypothetical protein
MQNQQITMGNAYTRFLNNKMIQESNMKVFLRACEAYTGNGEFDIVSEAGSIGDSIKSGWEKFKAFIKKVFDSIMGALTQIFAGDKAWLERYKDTILTKETPDDLNITDAYDYETAIKRITDATVPVLNYEGMKADLKDRKTFLEKYFPGSTNTKDMPEGPDKDLTSGLTSFFLGTDKKPEQYLKDLNFTDLYNFCYTQDKILGNIEKDRKSIENSSKSVDSAVANAIKNIKSEDNKAAEEQHPNLNPAGGTQGTPNSAGGTQGTPNSAGGTQGTPNSAGGTQGTPNPNKPDMTELNKFVRGINTILSDSMTTSDNIAGRVATLKSNIKNEKTKEIVQFFTIEPDELEKVKKVQLDANNSITKLTENSILNNIIFGTNFINELKVNGSNDGKSSGSTATVSNGTSVASANRGNIAGQAQTTYDGKTIKGDKSEEDAISEVNNNITLYQTCCSSIFSAKCTAIKTIYKDYMDIMRAKVKAIIGNEDKVANVSATTATNYSSSTYSPARKQAIDNAYNAYINSDSEASKVAFINIIKQIYGTNFKLADVDSGEEIKAALRYKNSFDQGYAKTQSTNGTA